MAFNFAKAEQLVADKKGQSKPLAAVVLGPSSSGKSGLMGTFGVPTLYLHTAGEEHGPDSAKERGGDIFDIEFDRDIETGALLGPDAAYKQLLEILRSHDWIKQKGFGAIALDGLTELEFLVRGTGAFKSLCLTKEGTHNGFAEGAAALTMLRPIMDALRNAQREFNLHYIVSCLLDVKKLGSEGEIEQSEPTLLGYKLAATLLPQFPDQLVIGRMINPQTGEMLHRLQFSAGISKAQLDMKTKEVKKFINFTPRVRNVASESLPDHMKADLRAVLKLKTGDK